MGKSDYLTIPMAIFQLLVVIVPSTIRSSFQTFPAARIRIILLLVTIISPSNNYGLCKNQLPSGKWFHNYGKLQFTIDVSIENGVSP